MITRFPMFTALVSSGAFLFVSFVILATCILPAVEWRLHSEVDLSDNESYAKSRRRLRRGNNQSTDGSDWSAQKPRGQKRSRSATTPRRTSVSPLPAKVFCHSMLMKIPHSVKRSKPKETLRRYLLLLPQHLCAIAVRGFLRPIQTFDGSHRWTTLS